MRILRRIETALTCNWLAIGFHCCRKGHDWRTTYPGRGVSLVTCGYCGLLRGTSCERRAMTVMPEVEMPGWGTEDYRRAAVLFNDITYGPVDLTFTEREALRRHMWEQGWRRDVRPEDVTPKPTEEIA